MSSLLPLILVLQTALLVVGAVVYLKRQKVAQEELIVRLHSATQSSRMPRHKLMQQGFQQRVLVPFAQRVFEAIQKYIPMTSQSWVRTNLMQAGFQKEHHLKTFIGIQVLLTGVLFSGYLMYALTISHFKFVIAVMLALAFGALGFFLPILWLLQKVKQRKESIQKSLPDFLDLLVICVEAGIGLDMAINKIAQLKTRRRMTILQDELNTYIKDIGLGKPRVEALYDLNARTGVEDLSNLVVALAQSFEMGTSITTILRVHSDLLRDKRLERAKEKANKIPVKMVLPIYIFLFPAIFLAIFGPLVMVIMETVTKTMQANGQS